MNKTIIHFTNQYTHQIKENEKFILKNQEHLTFLQESSHDDRYIKVQTKKTTDRIQQLQEEIEDLQKRIVEVQSGKYKHLLSKPEPLKPKKKKEVYVAPSKSEKRRPASERFMRNSYNRMLSFEPNDHLKKALAKMPQNQGRKIGGIVFFGEKPKEKGKPILIFEKNIYCTRKRKVRNKK